MMDNETAALRAMGELETVRAEIQDLADNLERISLWRPAVGLRKSCQAALGILDRLAERLDRKLVITLVGPCGSGKSTLLNALAGVDDLSLSGHRRPTTQNVVAFCRQPEDARQLAEQLDAEDLRIRTREGAQGLENVILIDTPDTDSTHQKRHIPLVRQAIGLSDVLICVFDGENPKRRDHTDFLAPYVRLFSGSSLVVAVNKCDRLDEKELTDTIMPEFAEYIRQAWSVEPAATFCLSARSHLQHPGWDADAGPRHGRDQFGQLQRLIRETFNDSGFSVDRRLENARSIRDDLYRAVREEARRESSALKAAMDRIAACETEAMGRAMEAFRSGGGQLSLGINVRLYQQLAQRWLGPVGWLVAVWTRILVFGTGLAALLRFGNPVRQLFGAVSVVRRRADSKKALDAADQGSGAPLALLRYNNTIARAWPEIAEKLIDARFAPAVREAQRAPGHGDPVGQRLEQIWNEVLEKELSDAGRRLSGGLLQLLFNLPVLGVLGYVGWLTALNFFTGNILSSDFFLHAFWTIVLVLFLSFFLLQGVIRLAAGKEKLVERVFDGVQRSLDDESRIGENPVWQQVRIILELGGAASSRREP